MDRIESIDGKLRIFVSSPGDVSVERRIAHRVIERLQVEFEGQVELDPIFWEYLPMRSTDTFQSQIPLASEAHIAIFILWSRLGTPLPREKFIREDGEDYASGTEFEFELAMASHRLNNIPDVLTYRKVARPIVDLDIDEDKMHELRQQRAALQAFVDKWFLCGQEGTLKAAFTDFETPDEFEEKVEVHLRQLILDQLPEKSIAPPPIEVKPVWTEGSPFRGLRVFDFQHEQIFCGRTRAVHDVIQSLMHQRARRRPLTVVLGMSGSGKSSLVLAGVVPVLTEPGVIESVGVWRRASMRPSNPAKSLHHALAIALSNSYSDGDGASTSVNQVESLATLLEHNPVVASSDIVDRLDAVGNNACLALVVDQLEELFTQRRLAEHRDGFIRALTALAESRRVWVIGTLRSDFYDRTAAIPELVNLMEGNGQFHLLPPTPAEIGRMIRQPAALAGLRFEQDDVKGNLDDVLRDAAVTDPSALPLLEFALDELYQQRSKDGLLTHKAYESLGGVEGALAQRAEDIYCNLPRSVRESLPAVMRTLTTIAEGEALARRRASRDELSVDAQQQLVEAFVRGRLFVADESGVRIAHEALLTQWPRLLEWFEEDQQYLKTRARVAASSQRWFQEQQESSLLLAEGRPLAEAEDLLHRRREELSDDVISYIEASQHASRDRVEHERRRSRRIIGAIGTALVVACTLAVVSFVQYRKAENQRVIANEEKKNAQGLQREAEDARDEAQRLRVQADGARRRSEVATYLSQLAIVDREIRDGQITHARDLLINRCQTDLRGWEHAYLTAICQNRTQFIARADKRLLLVEYTKNGGELVTVASDGTVQIIDHFNGERIDEWKCEFQDPFVSVCLSPDEGKLYFGFKNGKIGVADLEGDKIQKLFDAHKGPIDELVISPNSHAMVSGTNSLEDDSVELAFWKQLQLGGAPTGDLIRMEQIGFAKKKIYKFALTGNGKLFVMSKADQDSTDVFPHIKGRDKPEQRIVTVYNTKSSKSEGQTFPINGSCMAANYDGSEFVVGGVNGRLTVFRADGTFVADWQAHQKKVIDVAYVHDGRAIASVSPDQSLCVWHPSTGERFLVLSTNDAIVESMIPHPTEPSVVTRDMDGNLRSWNVERRIFRRTIKPTDDERANANERASILSLAIRSDGQRIAAGLETAGKVNGLVGVWDLELYTRTLEQRDSLRFGLPVTQVDFDPHTGSVVALTGGRLEVSGENQYSTPLPDFSAERSDIIAFATDHVTQEYAAALENNKIVVGDGTTIEVEKGPVGVMAFCDNGQNLLWSTCDNSVIVWDLKEQKAIVELSGHSAPITGIAISSNSLLVATASADKTIKVWDKKTGREIHTLIGHDLQVNAVVFNASGTRLASASNDETVRLWHVESGVLLRTLKDIQDPVTSVAFSPDGVHISCGTSKGNIIVWSIPEARDAESHDGAKFRQKYSDVYLDDLREVEFHVGHGKLGKHGATGYELSKMFGQVKFKRTFPIHALSMPPPANGSSYVVYELGEKFKRLKAEGVILNSDNATGRPGSPLTFRILGDKYVLYESEPLQNFRDSTENIELDVTGIRYLRLEVACPGSNDFARAAWLNPRLTPIVKSPE